MDFLKELLALREEEQENVAASSLTVDDEVHGQLEKAAQDDDTDAQCFGLEMEDGKVVKVYVKQEDAEAFEEAMSKRLGEEDDIKTALEELGKEFEIIEIVWPDGDEEDDEDEEEEDEDKQDDEDSEDEDSGADAMDSEVDYDDEKKQESLTLGQRFAKRITELKWSDEERSEYDKASPKGDDDEEEENLPDPDEPKPQAPQGADSSWTIDKDDDGIKIANDRFSIELDDDEMMELMNAIADKKIARFKNEHGKVVYVFSPRGSEYILKTPEYQGGFRLPKDVVNKILD